MVMQHLFPTQIMAVRDGVVIYYQNCVPYCSSVTDTLKDVSASLPCNAEHTVTSQQPAILYSTLYRGMNSKRAVEKCDETDDAKSLGKSWLSVLYRT